MRNRNFFATLTASVLCCAVAAQVNEVSEIRKFKGVPFGTNAPAFVSTYKPGGEWATKGGTAFVEFSAADAAILIWPPTALKANNFGGYYASPLDDTIGSIPAWITFVCAVQSAADMEILSKGLTRAASQRALFREVRATIDWAQFDRMLEAVTAKYGEPAEADKDSGIYKWGRESVRVTLKRKKLGRPGRSEITIIDTAILSLGSQVSSGDM